MNNDNMMILAFSILAGVAVIYLIFYFREKKSIKKEKKSPVYSAGIQLQAYERLTILTERISLKNLISRLLPSQMDAQTYHALLVESIRQEYEYNLSQQLYVSAQVWQAITNFKEQNIFILHQLANTLPQAATGMDLSRRVVELLDANPNTSLHNIVMDSLRFEAQRLTTVR